MNRDWADIIGGGVLAASGAAAALWAWSHYELGTLRAMGPGAFPMALGLCLAVLGLCVALPALGRSGTAVRFQPGATVAVLAAILVFGLGLRPLGLVAATALSVLIAAIPAPRPGLGWRLILSAAVTALTLVVFSYGLQMTLPLWPAGL